MNLIVGIIQGIFAIYLACCTMTMPYGFPSMIENTLRNIIIIFLTILGSFFNVLAQYYLIKWFFKVIRTKFSRMIQLIKYDKNDNTSNNSLHIFLVCCIIFYILIGLLGFWQIIPFLRFYNRNILESFSGNNCFLWCCFSLFFSFSASFIILLCDSVVSSILYSGFSFLIHTIKVFPKILLNKKYGESPMSWISILKTLFYFIILFLFIPILFWIVVKIFLTFITFASSENFFLSTYFLLNFSIVIYFHYCVYSMILSCYEIYSPHLIQSDLSFPTIEYKKKGLNNFIYKQNKESGGIGLISLLIYLLIKSILKYMILGRFTLYLISLIVFILLNPMINRIKNFQEKSRNSFVRSIILAFISTVFLGFIWRFKIHFLCSPITTYIFLAFARSLGKLPGVSPMTMMLAIGLLCSLPLQEILILYYFFNACFFIGQWIFSENISNNIYKEIVHYNKKKTSLVFLILRVKKRIRFMLFLFFPEKNILINIIPLLIIMIFTGLIVILFHFNIGRPTFPTRAILGRIGIIIYFYYKYSKYLL